MLLNEVRIIGKIYNPKERTTNSGKTITEFGLSIYAGKNKEGKSQYKFMNCKIWDSIGTPQGDQLIEGKIAFDVWEKEGKEMSKPYILCNSVLPAEEKKQDPMEKVAEFKDDDIPF